MILSRRHLFAGLAALIAAPTIVRAASIMPVRMLPLTYRGIEFEYDELGMFGRYSGYDVLNIGGEDIVEAASFDWSAAIQSVSVTGAKRLARD